MRTAIDDLPGLSSSRLRALGEIRPRRRPLRSFSSPAARFSLCLCSTFPFSQRRRLVFLRLRPAVARCRTLRLFSDALACKGWTEADGLRYRVEDMGPWPCFSEVASPAPAAPLRSSLRMAASSPAFALEQAWSGVKRLEMALAGCEFILSQKPWPLSRCGGADAGDGDTARAPSLMPKRPPALEHLSDGAASRVLKQAFRRHRCGFQRAWRGSQAFLCGPAPCSLEQHPRIIERLVRSGWILFHLGVKSKIIEAINSCSAKRRRWR